MRRIGDDMSNNAELNTLIGGIRVTPETAYKTFCSVAIEIFQDGSINWGRIATLFYFAYKLALQVLNQLPLFDIVMGWVTKFIAERLARWIISRGGWVSLASCCNFVFLRMIRSERQITRAIINHKNSSFCDSL